AFLIQEVAISLYETNSTTTEYVYDVRFGGKMVGVREFLESLASEVEEVQDATQILTIEQLTEAVELDDDAPTKTNTTPPFQYGPAGSPQGVWNKSEYA